MGAHTAARTVAVIASLCVGLQAQQSETARAPRPPDSQPPVFRAGLDLVRLDVRVVDADGRPIKDVRREELEIVEEGRVRPIVLFQHVEEPSGSYLEVARRTIGSEVSTNQGAPRGHLYVIVFDQSHIAPGNEQRARRAAEQFLRNHVGRGDRVALYALPGPGPQIEFTSDVTRPISVLPQVRGGHERVAIGALGAMRVDEAYEITRGNQEVLTRVSTGLSNAAGSSDAVGLVAQRQSEDAKIFTRLVQEDARTMVAQADAQAREFLLRFADVIRSVKDIEGRKAVILLSEGFFIDHLTRELETVAAAAAESYSAIYALDLNSRDLELRDVTGSGAGQFAEIQNRLAPLATLANETDGLLMNYANSWIGRAFERAADQSRDYYIVGFEPDPAADRHSSHYRRIKVRVKRSGAYVNARSGYSIGGRTDSGADSRRAIDAAMGAPFPQQGLPIEYTTYTMRGSSAGIGRVIVCLSADLPVASTSESRPAQVAFVVRAATDGRVVASGTEAIPLPSAARSGEGVGAALFRVQFELPAGQYLMRTVVREPGGTVGSADRRFAVRRLDSAGVTAGDLIVASADTSGLPVRANVYRGGVLAGALELYGRSLEQLGDIDVVVELVPAGESRPVTSTHADLKDPTLDAVGARREARVVLPLRGVAPGQYIARAIVRAGGEDVAELPRDVTVRPGDPPVPATPSSAGTAPPDIAGQVLSGELARQYIRNLASSGTPAVSRAAALLMAGEWERGEAELSADTSARAAALRALARFGAGDLVGAREGFKEQLDANPYDSRAAFFLGWVHASSGDDRQAIGAWRNATFLDPTLTPAHLALVEAYLRLHEPALAIQVVRAGLSAVPNSPELRDRLAQLQR